jgi:hypothetical protein
MFEFSNQQCDESSLDWACKIFFLIDLLKLSADWVNNFLKKKKKTRNNSIIAKANNVL